jgi:hypothetical protein
VQQKLYIAVVILTQKSRDSVVGIATGNGLENRGVGVRVPVGPKMFTSPCRPDGF